MIREIISTFIRPPKLNPLQMKKTTIFIVMILISGIIYGQENSNVKNSARFGINGAFFGSGDIIGPSIYGEYSISLNDYFAIVPRFMCAYATSLLSHQGT